MEFSKRKLPAEAAPRLRICPIETVQPYALMLAPVYVFLKANGKYLSVKAPLDFFTPEELVRLQVYENFFFPEFVESALPFRETARSIASLIRWNPSPGTGLSPASYELSDAVLRRVGPLWDTNAVIEPFFVAVFTNEICDLLPGDMLLSARNSDVYRFERAIFRSSWAVFLAVHLGYCELSFLNRLRRRVFDEEMSDVRSLGGKGEVDELIWVVCETLLDGETRSLCTDAFRDRKERVCQKLSARLERVKTTLVPMSEIAPTIYGERGFVDV